MATTSTLSKYLLKALGKAFCDSARKFTKEKEGSKLDTKVCGGGKKLWDETEEGETESMS